MKQKRLRSGSIQNRMIGIMLGMLAVVMAINLYLYAQINSMVERIDHVFSSNVNIQELSDTLDQVEDNVYSYLNTKGSKSLEDYYRYAQEYRNLLELLNQRNVNNRIRMLEKNIRGMSESYLEKVEKTVQAKRGRNVEQYKGLFEEEKQLYRYINDYIYELNQLLFKRNSENYQFLLKTMYNLEMFSLVIILIAFAVSLSAVVMIVHSLIHPLVDLSAAAHEVAEGNFDVEIPAVNTNDEIGIVTRTFAQMVKNLKAYIVRLKNSLETEAAMKERELSMEAHLKEAQLRFLQAQINPHFLFNSLNAGSQLATMEEADATGVFLEKMADFFRYNVQKSHGDSTLMEEIALVDNYIYILNVRFAGDITYDKVIPEDIGNPAMPGMILQPLVENAITHGIRDRLDHGKILLQVETVEDGIEITVTDNGIGMSKEQIQEVLAGTYREETDTESTGIGLANVRNRLQLYYNREDLFGIHSDGTGLGTSVTVLLPVNE